MNNELLSLLLDTQQNIIKKIALGAGLDACLTSICEGIESAIGSSDAKSSILLLKGDQLYHGAAPTLPQRYCEAIDGVGIGPSVGSCGTAAFTGKQVVVSDIEHDSRWADFKPYALEHNLRACWSTPIMSSQNEILGTFAIYYSQVKSPTDFHLSLISLFTHLASFAIEKQRNDDSLRRAALVFNNSSECMAVTDSEGFIIDVNPAYSDVTGYSREDALGLHVSKLSADSHGQNFYQQLVGSLKSGGQWEGEVCNKRKNGEMFQAWASISTVFNSDKEIVQYVALYRDISKHKMAEEHIRKLSQVVEQSPVAVVITDPQGNIEYVNRKFELTTGYTNEEVLGKNPRILKSGETSGREYERLWETLIQGDVWSGEFHNKHKDGSFYWEKASIGALKNTDQETTGYIAIKEDITQLKEDERQLRLASTVFETSSEAIMVTDAQSRIQMVNKAFTQITGYEPEEVLGQGSALLNPRHRCNQSYDDLLEALRATDTWEGEIESRRKNGDAYPEWLAISTIRDSAGKREGYVSLFSDITKRKQDEERIRKQANFDSLTGLANRNLFADRFARAIDVADRGQKRVALLFIDLDRFKYVNDTLGHSTGDQLLQEVSRRLVGCLRKSDTVARLGGDEFAVVLPEATDSHHVEGVVIHILNSLAQPYSIEGYEVFTSASIGVTVYPDDGVDTETLLRKADTAMYGAKEKGRNDFQFFTLEMDIEAQKRRKLERALYQALDKGEFTLNFQPIMDMANSTINSVEALVRWNHPERGLVSPAEFISLAEEIGLIAPIGEWVLREACREAVTWSKLLKQPPSIAVNLSSTQLQRQDIPSLVKSVLEETGLPAERLTLEITESLLLADDDKTLCQLQDIRALGVGLSIDDFGTGYSSLRYLKKFPVTTLKIDRSFITGLPRDLEDAALVEAILAMAKSLHMKVIVEGVENEDQARFLTFRNCRYLQGYLYSRPLPKADLNAYMKGFVDAEGNQDSVKQLIHATVLSVE